MAATSFYHGVTTVLVDTGPRTIAVPSTSVVGIVDTGVAPVTQDTRTPLG
ncbi:hypothetical protein [Burkholderia multivorans]|nr:hypothetical protein [Burkholderia multivorans]UQP67254.1 hypothetical protein L0Y82_20320 [Burkholderia multivorans]